jgi:diaminopimelate epimerase
LTKTSRQCSLIINETETPKIRNRRIEAEEEMQKVNYVKCYPGGNTTTLVFDGADSSRYVDIARRIMAGQPDVEQVGFVVNPTHPTAVARLQMAGGEFCGNAARSLAYVLTQKEMYGLNPAGSEFFLEVSGTSRILAAKVKGNNSRVAMPINSRKDAIRSIGELTIVELEGIAHVLVNQQPPADLMAEARRILDETGLKSLQSAGVVYWTPCREGIRITPVVWVRDVETLVAETACGSGTVCVAIAQAAGHERNGIFRLPVYQPSGGGMDALVEFKNGSLGDAFIEGPVEILEEGELTI